MTERMHILVIVAMVLFLKI